MTLQFCPTGLNDERSPDIHPSRESVDFDREPNRVHLMSKFIMNGVCVRWVGWIDLETLSGKAKLMFDEEQAKVIKTDLLDCCALPIPHSSTHCMQL